MAEVCRKLGTSEQTYYRWRKEDGGLRVTHLKRLKALELENGRSHAVAVQHHQVIREWFHDLSVARDVGEQSQWRDCHGGALHGPRSFQPRPFIPFRSIPKRQRVASIFQD